jgi:hypothetical protein
MRICALAPELIAASRIGEAAARIGADYVRADSIDELPMGSVDLLLVDWGSRGPDWGDRISRWRAGSPAARIVVFGPHADLDAHAAAKRDGLGPMMARSRLFRRLDDLLAAGAGLGHG